MVLGIVMFVGGMIGGKIALKLSSTWLRRAFLAAVLILAIKILLFDLFLNR